MGLVRSKGWRWVWLSTGVLGIFAGLQALAGFLMSLTLVATLPAGTDVDGYKALLDSLMPAMLFGSQLLCLVVGVPWWRRVSQRARPAEPMGPVRAAGLVVLLLVLGVAAQLVISTALTFVLPLFPDLESDYGQAMQDIGGTSLVSVLSLAVMAPVVEETFFRGLALNYARRGFSAAAAANVLQALLFGIAHGNLVQGLYAFALGLLLGLVRLRYGRLWPCMVLHLGMNASSFLIDAISSMPDLAGTVVLLGGCLASVVVLGVGVWRMASHLPADDDFAELPALPPAPHEVDPASRPPRPEGL